MSSISGSGERILAILDLFSEDRPLWTPDEMMAALGYSRPTLYRYLKTLKDRGYLTSHAQAGYVLGPRVTELDYLMTRSDPMIAAGEPELQTLAARFPGTAFLVRWYGRKLLCVASVVSSEAPKSSYPRGRPMPIGRGAISRAIAANLPNRDRRALVEEYLDAFAVTGVGSSVDEVLAALRDVRKAGTSTAWGEITPGVVAVAGPVFGTEKTPLGAICLTRNEAALAPDGIGEIRKGVKNAAERLSERLGKPKTSAGARVAGDRPARTREKT